MIFLSKILDDITTNSISLSECLQRLLVISNKIENNELAEWCLKELNGYKNYNDLPDYRKVKSRNILYSGINGCFQVTNQPLQYLSKKTLDLIENVGLFENIIEIEKRKDFDKPIYKDLTFLASEVYENTTYDIGGVQCTSIKQMISQESYTNVYIAVKTRIINLLCSFENSGINLDSADIHINKKNKIENDQIYNQVVIHGNTYTPDKKEKKIIWNVFIPIITGVISAIAGGVIVYLITEIWMK